MSGEKSCVQEQSQRINWGIPLALIKRFMKSGSISSHKEEGSPGSCARCSQEEGGTEKLKERGVPGHSR